MNDNELDRLFRETLAENEAAPPASTWSAIERKLDGAKRRPGGWYWGLSGLLVLLIGVAAWWWMTPSSPAGKTLAENRSPELPVATTGLIPSGGSTDSKASSNTSIPAPTNAGDVSATGIPAVTPSTDYTPAASETVSYQHPAARTSPGAEPGVEKTAPTGTSTAAATTETANPQPTRLRPEPGKWTGQEDPAPKPSSKGKPAPELFAGDGENPGDTPPVVGQKTMETPANVNTEPGEPANPVADLTQKGTAATVAEQPEAKTDSTHPVAQEKEVPADSVKKETAGIGTLPPPPKNAEPKYYAGFHGAMESQTMHASAKENMGFKSNDILLYGGQGPSIVQETYSYGARFGWFATKHFSVLGGVYYSTFEVHSPGRFFYTNQNEEKMFTFHTATASTQMSSSAFDVYDSYIPPSDTLLVHMISKDSYSYLNLQLGGAWYPLRTRFLSAYVNVLSNGAYLASQHMTLSATKSGKRFEFSGDAIDGMNKFTLGGQTGVGVELTPVPNLGLWIEPAYFFSTSVNRKNSLSVKPMSMRLQFGLAVHF